MTDGTTARLALSENDARLRLVLDATGTGTFVWHAGQDRSEADERTLELFGLTQVSELTLADTLATLLHPDDRERYGVAVSAALDPQGPGQLQQDIRVVLGDGTLRWLSISAQVERLRLDEGGPRMFGTAFDITERTRAEAERELRLERQQSGRAAADAFLAVISHELRTPVTSIFGAASFVAKHPDRGDLRELLEGMEDDAERLVRIVDDLMVLSGAERGLVPLAQEPMLVQRVVPEILGRLRKRFPAVMFEFDAAPAVPTILADPTAVGQIIYNILANAAIYAGSRGAVRIAAALAEGSVEVSIVDSGPGLGPDPERLFSLYQRGAHTSGTAAGSGIGLYVARELVHAMGGTIEGSTLETGGASFRFTLPIADVEDDSP